MDQLTSLAKKYAKAIAAFIVTLLANMLTDLGSGKAPWPQDLHEWLRYLGTSIAITAVVFGVPNSQDKGQVASSLRKLPDDAAKEAVVDAYPRWTIRAA